MPSLGQEQLLGCARLQNIKRYQELRIGPCPTRRSGYQVLYSVSTLNECRHFTLQLLCVMSYQPQENNLLSHHYQPLGSANVKTCVNLTGIGSDGFQICYKVELCRTGNCYFDSMPSQAIFTRIFRIQAIMVSHQFHFLFYM